MQRTKFFGLGGMREIGKAGFIIEHEDEIVMVDNGIKFSNSIEIGVQAIIPDYSYLTKNQKKIKGLFITHGHEDHMGGIPYLLRQVDVKKIYAPNIAIAFIKDKLEKSKIENEVEFIEIKRELVVKTKHFTIDFWTAQHSVPDAFGVRVNTPNGSIFYTGDFRFDYTPLGNMTDFAKLEQMGKENMTVLLSDSTNAFSQDHSPTEKNILKDLEKFTLDAKGKVIITTFASQLTRIQSLIEMACKHNKKIVALGRSMIKNIEFARKLNYIKVDESKFIDKKNISRFPDKELFVITTGSQGEEKAALSRMAAGKHAQIKLKKDDVVIFSSSPIPGNRIKIELLVNQLYKHGVDIKEHRIDGMLHVSGHAYKDEHIKIFNITKPKYFLPFHGSYRMSAAHGVTAMQTGVKKENIYIPKNGRIMYLENEKLIVTNEKEEVGPIYIDSNTISLTNSQIIKKREELGKNGFVNIVAVIDKNNNNIVGRTRIISRGTIFTKTSKELLNEVQKMAHGTILHIIKNVKNWTKKDLKESVAKRIGTYFYKIRRRNPIILTSILFH